MKDFYERYAELAQKKKYSMGLDVERENIDIESQFLNSQPEEKPLIGMLLMTGKGIDEEVDDLSFVGM